MAFWKKKQPAEPMISKAEHDRIVAANDRIALTGRQSLHVLIKQKDEEIGYFQVENARLLAELATLKAERDRRLAPLAAANAARKAKAQAARGGDVRESV